MFTDRSENRLPCTNRDHLKGSGSFMRFRCYECGCQMKKPYAIFHWSKGRPPKNYCWLCWAKLGINSEPGKQPWPATPYWAWAVLVAFFIHWFTSDVSIPSQPYNMWLAAAIVPVVFIAFGRAAIHTGEFLAYLLRHKNETTPNPPE